MTASREQDQRWLSPMTTEAEEALVLNPWTVISQGRDHMMDSTDGCQGPRHRIENVVNSVPRMPKKRNTLSGIIESIWVWTGVT